MTKKMFKSVLKYIGLGVGMVVAVISLISIVQYISYRFSPEYQKIQEAKKMISDYENDPYGGDTPEETLRMFIDALKKGDTDLAARYFVMEKQGEWKKNLLGIKSKNLLNYMIKDLERAELSKKDQSEAFFIVTNKNNEVTTQMIIRPIKDGSGKWKISEL